MKKRKLHDEDTAAAIKRKWSSMVQQQKQELDKFQVATLRLIDTVHGHHSGNHPATSVDNVRAVCELISGYTKYLQKEGKLPSDIRLIYSFEIDSDSPRPDLNELSVEARKKAREQSNFSKHADRSAGKTMNFCAYSGLQILMFNMMQDYETLHCALIKNELLNSDNEKLYPIKRAALLDFHEYKDIFHPYYSSGQRLFSEASLTGMFLNTILLAEQSDDEAECYVPAGAAVCIIARNSTVAADKRVAEKIKTLGIWPADSNTNAYIIRNFDSSHENKHEL